ncbi:hypothetical protein [Clostridium sp.]|uniref:hypothetical protein n=1 Tax=Clostridium sp. TaxID=1506 RepID=UPI001A3FBE27|nr:hypothetical protein [Clostridium sp.]MBK5241722.1 hypothetical protein [Clostridium sp.]
MKDSERNKNSLIDEFYNESQEKTSQNTVNHDADLEFRSVLNSTAKKMDVLNEDIFDFDIDTLSIIEQGECIKENWKNKKEFILFILSSIIILSLCSIATIKIGPKLLIISQVIIVTIVPWIIIPVLAMKRRGSEV